MPALTTLSPASLLPVAIDRGEGATLFDTDGNAYADLYGGHAVALLGQGHPRWVAALSDQARTLSFVSTVAPVPLRLDAAESILVGSQLDAATIQRAEAAAQAAIAPISDLRSSADYRRRLLGVYVKRGVSAAVHAAGGRS